MDELLKTVCGILVTILAAATPLLVTYVVKWLSGHMKKLGMEMNDQELETLKKIAEEGVALAAQKAKVKAKNGGDKATSEEKKELALSFARKLATKYGLSPAGIEALDELIEGGLAKNPDCY